MILVYGDDSAGEKKERVCAVGVVIGTEDRWKDLEEKWLERTGGIPFHANECESDRGDYANRPHEANKTLYRDLTTLLVESELGGWGVKRIALPQSGRGRGCPVQTKSRFGSVLHREHWATEPVLHREHSAPERWLVVKF